MASQIQIQVQAVLNKAFAADLTLFDKYLGKRVIVEEEEVGNDVSIGTLQSHGAQFAEFADYLKLSDSLRIVLDNAAENRRGKGEPEINYNNRTTSVISALPVRILAKSQVASIQPLEDVLQGLVEEEVVKR